MRIALVCDYSLTYLGGAQTAFLEQAKALTAAGHHVVIFAPAGFDGETGAARNHWVDARVTLPILGLPLIRNTAALRDELAAAFVRDGVDVVHVHSEFGLAAASITAAQRLGIRTAHTVHSYFWDAHLPSLLQSTAAWAINRFSGWICDAEAVADRPRNANGALRAMTLSTARRVDVVISPSEHQRRKLMADAAGTVVQIPNTTMRPDGVRPLPLTSVDGPLRVIWVGRCVQEKRLLPFIDACMLALDALPAGSLEVEVVGDGAQLPAARHRAAGHPQISFPGRLDSAEVAERMASSHLLALTSMGFDNQPMTIVEALFAARPVLYVDPALTEGVDQAGFLCGAPTPQAMAWKLQELVLHPALVVDGSRLAAEAFTQFAPEVVAARLTSVYAGATHLVA